ncbi:MAG: hypothetical protein JWN70_1106 [Planctomycetaceae bacterium]|nr:hypothetical protein [Planctomycetaceae bacterium]
MTKTIRRVLIGAGVLSCLLAIEIGWRVYVFTSSSRLKVGPDTTVVEGPVRDDGTVDFEAALHQRSAAGITPENNAAIPLGMAFGTALIPTNLRERYFQYLGIPEPPELDEYFVTPQAFAQHLTQSPSRNGEKYYALLDEIGVTQLRPWKRHEHPEIFAWIEGNEPYVKLIEEASLRSHFYAPLVTAEGLMNAPLPLLEELRGAVRLLHSRAMLRIAEEDLDGASADLLTCHRLANLVGRNSVVIGNLVAIAQEATAIEGDRVWLSQPLNLEQIQRFQAVISALPHVTDVSSTIDRYERFMSLDSMQSLWRGTSSLGEPGEFLRFSRIDINVAMRRINRHYETLVIAMRQAGARDRLKAVQQLDAASMTQLKEAFFASKLAGNLLWKSRTAVTEWMADIFLRLVAPATVQLQIAEERSRMRRDLLQVALALARYHAKFQTYPEQLEMLKPDYLQQIPIDRFINQPLHYKRLPNGYLLYSVGDDEQDENGQPREGGKPGHLAFKVIHESEPRP